jgi:hypothetical protein
MTKLRQVANSTVLGLTLTGLLVPDLAWARWTEDPHPQQTPQQQLQQQQQQQNKEDKKDDQDNKKQQKRVSPQEQQERIRKQEANMQLYRQNLALKEELAERDAKVLQQQKRLAQYQFQQRYYERLRQQRASTMNARYDYNNDPFYYTGANYRYRRDGRDYQTNEYGIDALKRALNTGYKEGFHAGRADRQDRWHSDYRSSFAYQDANYGYDGRYLQQDEYNHYFREGFQRGYDDGYNGTHKFGNGKDNDNDNDNNTEWWIAGAVIAAVIGYEVLKD